MKITTTSILITIILSSILYAEEIEVTDVEAEYTNRGKVEATQELKQSINLGFSSTTGNTKTLNINGKYDLSFITTGYKKNPLKIATDFSAFFTENNSVKSNEEFVANLGLEQIIAKGWLGYIGISWLKNPDFKNYDNKSAIGIGLGKELYNDGTQLFIAKIGTSYNVEDYANNQATEKFGSLNEYLEYRNKLNTISKLYFKVGAMQNFDDMQEDYQATAVLGLNFAVGENINLSIEEEVAYDNLPPVGFKKTDTKSIVRLGYNF
jgi:putative salt-induced outer membrane protein YdiY